MDRNYNTFKHANPIYDNRNKIDESSPLLKNTYGNEYLRSIRKQEKYYVYTEYEKLLYVNLMELLDYWIINKEIVKDDENFLIYIYNPESEVIKTIGKLLQLHPLTIEDILLQENHEKVEIFKGYYLFSYLTMEIKLKEISKKNGIEDLLFKVRKKDYEYYKLILEQENVYSEEMLGEELGEFQHGRIFNLIFKKFIFIIHYGENDINQLIKLPNKKDTIDLVHLKLIRSLNEHMEKEFRLIENEIYKVDDFYLVGEGNNNLQPYYNGSHLSGKSKLPVRLDQLRQLTVLYEEIFINKPEAFRNLFYYVANNNGLNKSLNSIPSQTTTYLDLFKRKNRFMNSRSNTPRSSSPMPDSLPKIINYDLNDYNSLVLNYLHRIENLQVTNELLIKILERCSKLQKLNSELALTYLSIKQTKELAKLSGWAWAGIPLTFTSTLIGINVVVPGQYLKSMLTFYYYLLFMSSLSYLFFKVANIYGIL